MIKRFAAFLTAAAVMLTGCSIMNKDDSDCSKQIISYDGNYMIETPADWSPPKTKYSMNSNASIEAYCAGREICFCAIADPNVYDDVLPFDNYCVLGLRMISDEFNLTLSPDDLEDTFINSNKAKCIEIPNIEKEGDDIDVALYLFYYVIKTNDYVVQMMVWTPQDKIEENRAEITAVINTFSKSGSTDKK
ncbi:MAG: hypothetical protein Q4F95_04365 [Oscillospiraceae bacterium]|nr:hypothetical protein [Oscillospiraceae bacterium]